MLSFFRIFRRIFFAGFFIFSLLGAIIPVEAASGVDLVLRESCATATCKEFSPIGSDSVSFGRSLRVGETFSLDIVIKNPGKLPLYSVSSWVSYDPKIFKAENLSDEKSAFSLAAPDEFQIVEEEGHIKIGRATIGKPITTDEIMVAKVHFTVLQDPKNATMSFYDFQGNDLGHTAVLTVENIITKNLLENTPKTLTFSSSGGTQKNPPSLPTNTFISPGSTIVLPANSDPILSSNGVAIPRPEGLRARTTFDGGIEFIWKFGEDPRIEGYYIFYDEKSGFYMHRKDIGKTNVFSLLPGTFEKGKRMFFAIKAYGQGHQSVSDFSDEASLVIGTIGSESHPFYDDVLKKLGISENTSASSDAVSARLSAPKTPRTRTNAETGTNQGIFLFCIFAGISMVFGAATFFPKRKRTFVS